MSDISYSLKKLGILDTEKTGMKKWEPFCQQRSFLVPEDSPMGTLKAVLDKPLELEKDLFAGLHSFFIENAKPGFISIPQFGDKEPFEGLMAWLPTKQLVLSWDDETDPNVLLDGEAYATQNNEKFFFNDASVVRSESPHLFVICEVTPCTNK